ncbi:MAG: glycoside hydrolase family 2 protein [Bacteroidia bacterium]|nr:glycoside hydrolase family 2 protein [Bacteroidia bacterium]
MRFYLLAILIFCLISPSLAQIIPLSQNWTITHAPQNPAEKGPLEGVEVPGTVLQNLIQREIIPDPYEGQNERTFDWVYEGTWTWSKEFEVGEELLKKDRIEIVFEGIDTKGEVRINGQLPEGGGITENMFVEFRREIKPLLKPGKNTVTVTLQPVIRPEKDQSPRNYPAPSDAGKEKAGPYFRKAGYHYGWDWAPYLPGPGIWKPAYLEAWNLLKIREVKVEIEERNVEWAILKTEVIVDAAHPGRYILTVEAEDQFKPSELHFEARGGRQKIPCTIVIQNPKYWWPRGFGQQDLYHLKFNVAHFGNKSLVLDTLTIPYGLREIKLDRKPEPSGESFYFTVNGEPFFAKGANLVPGESILPRLKQDYYRNLISDAVESNVNMLRVWGGGIYEDDEFYRLCDSAGILVWQDLMFACSMYPADEKFRENVKSEIEFQAKRLRNHPSIALWCGNNEVNVAWHNWGWQNEYKISKSEQNLMWSQYLSLFDTLIPGLLAKHVPHFNYIPTSPLSNWGKKENFRYGNMHYWGVWHGEEPFENFRTNVPRFMTEYGFQSFPDLATLGRVIPEKELKLDSPTMKMRQKSYKGNGLIRKHMDRWYGKNSGQKFGEFVFLSQLLQKEALKIAISSHRVARPWCMGTMYWQFNDCWPAISWSTRDYLGRWKAAHYQVKRSYAELLISARLAGDTILVEGVNDGLHSQKGQLRLRLIDFEGKEEWSREVAVTLKSYEAKELFQGSKAFILQKLKPEKIVMVAEWVQNGQVQSRDLLYFALPAELELPKTQPTWKAESLPGQKGLKVTVTSPILIKDLTFQETSNHGHFDDNCFDLLPGESREIRFIPKKPFKYEPEALQVMHLNEILGK